MKRSRKVAPEPVLPSVRAVLRGLEVMRCVGLLASLFGIPRQVAEERVHLFLRLLGVNA